MQAAQASTLELAAPEHLGLDSRTNFRQDAVGLLDQLPERDRPAGHRPRAHPHVDSAGLGALMLIQRRARSVGRWSCSAVPTTSSGSCSC